MRPRVEDRRKHRADLAGEALFVRAIRPQGKSDGWLPVDCRTGEKGMGDAWVMVEQLRKLLLQLLLGRTILLAGEYDILRLELGRRPESRVVTPPCQPREHAASAVRARRG